MCLRGEARHRFSKVRLQDQLFEAEQSLNQAVQVTFALRFLTFTDLLLFFLLRRRLLTFGLLFLFYWFASILLPLTFLRDLLFFDYFQISLGQAFPRL